MGKSLNLKRIILEAMLILLLIALGWEWLKGLPYFTDTEEDSLWIFLVPFIGFLLIYAVLPWKWLRFFFSLIFFIFWFQKIEWGTPFFKREWVVSTWSMIKTYAFEMIRMNWNDIDPILRTGFFFLLIWILVAVLYYRVMVSRKVMSVLFVSIVYLATLDTFTLFDGKYPMIKSIAFGFAMLAVVNINKVEIITKRNVAQLKMLPWLISSLVIVLAFTSVGFLSPKAAPSWPDPVKFFKSMKGGDGEGEGYATSGYSKDDRELGGSFKNTMGIVMTGTVVGDRYPAHYWRGESKEYYTGKGWLTYNFDSQPIQLNKPLSNSLMIADTGTLITESILYNEPNYQILSGGQLQKVLGLTLSESNPRTESVMINQNYLIKSNNLLSGYLFQSLIPNISEQKLYDVSEDLSSGKVQYADAILRLYTQLPNTLPERVKLLGNEIVGKEENVYKQVKAIENFLRYGKFKYQINDIPYPEEGQDFVDQFLFETKQGYCDHFSTSMVILLRTQGIPARWVKGYTFGELKSIRADIHTVTVREKNAHSWVEVYFPEVGWVPFEPTTSFTFPYKVDRADLNSEEVMAQVNLAEQRLNEIKERNPDLLRLKEKELDNQNSSSSSKKGIEKILLFVALFLLMGGLLFFYRRQLWFQLETLSVVKESGAKLIVRGYQLMMKWFGRLFAPRTENQTVREYSESLQLEENKGDMVMLTKAFEETRYGEKTPTLSKKDFLRIWRNLLKRLRM